MGSSRNLSDLRFARARLYVPEGSDPVTSQGDRDALRDAMARAGAIEDQWDWDAMGEDYKNSYRIQSSVQLDALLALPDVLLRVLLDTQKPCETCEGRGNVPDMEPGSSRPCTVCNRSGSVPLVDLEQILAALGMGGVVQENDDLHADLVKCLEVRGLALEEAATFVQPGPDGQDYIDRARLIAQWITTAYERHAEGEVSGHKAWVETELARLAARVSEEES